MFLDERDFVIKICCFLTVVANARNLQKYEGRFSLIVEQTLTFTSSTNFAREIKNMSPNLKQNAWQYFKLLKIIIRIVMLSC